MTERKFLMYERDPGQWSVWSGPWEGMAEEVMADAQQAYPHRSFQLVDVILQQRGPLFYATPDYSQLELAA